MKDFGKTILQGIVEGIVIGIFVSIAVAWVLTKYLGL